MKSRKRTPKSAKSERLGPKSQFMSRGQPSAPSHSVISQTSHEECPRKPGNAEKFPQIQSESEPEVNCISKGYKSAILAAGISGLLTLIWARPTYCDQRSESVITSHHRPHLYTSHRASPSCVPCVLFSAGSWSRVRHWSNQQPSPEKTLPLPPLLRDVSRVRVFLFRGLLVQLHT